MSALQDTYRTTHARRDRDAGVLEAAVFYPRHSGLTQHQTGDQGSRGGTSEPQRRASGAYADSIQAAARVPGSPLGDLRAATGSSAWSSREPASGLHAQSPRGQCRTLPCAPPDVRSFRKLDGGAASGTESPPDSAVPPGAFAIAPPSMAGPPGRWAGRNRRPAESIPGRTLDATATGCVSADICP